MGMGVEVGEGHGGSIAQKASKIEEWTRKQEERENGLLLTYRIFACRFVWNNN